MSDANPKHSQGLQKLPLHLWPESATAYGSIGLMEGMLKYGRANWRATDVYASIYFAAAMRHLFAWMEGEDNSKEGVPHLGNALACLAILVDAKTHGTLIDDRNVVRDPDAHARMSEMLAVAQRRLEEQFGDRNPRHYDFRDKMDRPAPTSTDAPAKPTNPVDPVGEGCPFCDDPDCINAPGNIAKLSNKGDVIQALFGSIMGARDVVKNRGKIKDQLNAFFEKERKDLAGMEVTEFPEDMPPEVIKSIFSLRDLGIHLKEITVVDADAKQTKTYKLR